MNEVTLNALINLFAIFSAIITVIPSHVWAQAHQPVVSNHVSEQTLSSETTPVHPSTPTAMVLTSSTAYSTSKSATLSIGGVSGTFSVTTEAINPGDLAEAVDNPQDTTGVPLTFTTGDNPWFGHRQHPY